MKRKQKDIFSDMKGFAIGTGVVGLSAGVAGMTASQAPPGTPNLMSGFNTMGSFMPMIGTMVGAGTVLKMTKKMNRRR